MDLDARTLSTLDWSAVLNRLAAHARTPMGARAALDLPLSQDRDAVLGVYESVREVWRLEETDRVPVGGVADVGEPVNRAASGRVLEGVDLQDIGRSLQALEDLRVWLVRNVDFAPTLVGLATPISVDPELNTRLRDSFDERGDLSERTYPELGELRRQIRSLDERIRGTLERLVKGDSLSGVLQDRYVTQRGDRYVIPLKAEAKRAGLGIVHDTSKSGETVFVEPAEVVELANQLRVVEAQLRREIDRILSALSQLVGRFAKPILESIAAAVLIDLACARAGLGKELKGVPPMIGGGGVIRLRRARHPVLALRGIEVVPNDLRIDEQVRGLILSGPNTGGKTVALKTLGLAVLFCKAGLPFPAEEGSRIDLFSDLVADIGDLQTVEGDLSTFSGHLMVLREILRRAGPGVLVLLDEVAVGTDPAQGAAIARAVLEQVVDKGARVAVTTHYTDLKAFANADNRFSNAAVHLDEGRPTFELRMGVVGLSHAFSIARRLGLDPAVVARAESLVPEDTRRVGELLEALEGERVAAGRLRAEAERERQGAAQRRQELDDALEKIRGKTQQIAEREAKATVERLRDAEDKVKALIAALQANPELRLAGKNLEEIRQIREQAVAAPPPVVADPAPAPPAELAIGDRVRVRSLGAKARVVGLPRKGQVEVEVGGLRSRVALSDLTREVQGREQPVTLASVPRSSGKIDPARLSGVRLPVNTCDVRGQRVDEALDKIDAFLDKLVRDGMEVAFILHGHGTGALKVAVRAHLSKAPQVSAWRPANANEGGDAYTVVGV